MRVRGTEPGTSVEGQGGRAVIKVFASTWGQPVLAIPSPYPQVRFHPQKMFSSQKCHWKSLRKLSLIHYPQKYKKKPTMERRVLLLLAVFAAVTCVSSRWLPTRSQEDRLDKLREMLKDVSLFVNYPAPYWKARFIAAAPPSFIIELQPFVSTHR